MAEQEKHTEECWATPREIWIDNDNNDTSYHLKPVDEHFTCYVRQDIADERVREAWDAAMLIIHEVPRSGLLSASEHEIVKNDRMRLLHAMQARSAEDGGGE